jgi:DNA-binding transcriptional ArsR family regulator/cell division protein FtsB
MSDSDEEPYSTIFASLKHPIRRRILRMLSKKPMSFSEMLEVLGVSSSFLTYHLENLGELLGKIDDGKYKLSSFGEAAMATMTKVEDIPATVPQQFSEHSETRSHKWSGRLGIITRKFKMDETKPKKMVRRSAAIALGIICILLIAFIAYFSITGISAQNSYDTLQNQNKQLQTWLDGNETLLNQTQDNNTNLQNEIDSLNSTSLQSEVNNMTDILNLDKSTTLYNGTITIVANTLEMTMLEESTPYAGYATVQVSSPIGEIVTVTAVWDYYPILRYQNDFNAGSNGTAIFPVLPPGMVVYFSTLNSTETANVTITYNY